jgi:hypothetical protein
MTEKSLESSGNGNLRGPGAAWVGVGLVAAASALAGGLATAWWYRKTLHRLQEGEAACENPQYGILSEDKTPEE